MTTAATRPRLLEDALQLAELGWEVLPLRGKVPQTPHGCLDASCNPEVVASWWRRWPRANIGVAVPEQLLVLDVDPRHGGLDGLAELEQAHGPLPPTLTVWSGRGDGGHHLYYLRPAGRLTSTRLPSGIDLKVSGYCVVPPSLHPATGAPYRWDEQPVAELPLSLRARLRLPQAPPPRSTAFGAAGRGEQLVAFVARQEHGNRNRALYWAACRAREEGLLDELSEALIAAAVAAGHTERRARRTVASAARVAAA